MTICAYCGEDRTLTNEDVWPVWIANLPLPPGATDPRFTNLVDKDKDTRRSWDSVGFLGQKARAVCAVCNNGWMSGLEADAGRVLKPMIMGQRVTLNPDEQQLIALWTSKTHQMYRYGLLGRPPAVENMRQLYEKREPPLGTLTFLAAWNGKPGAAFLDNQAHLSRLHHIRNDVMDDKVITAERLTSRIGYLVIQTVEIVPPTDEGVPWRAQPLSPEAAANFHFPIWPRTETPRSWPPRVVLDDLGFERFTQRFANIDRLT